MPVIFGYGSLINPRSAEKTLGRSLCSNELSCTTLPDHLRSWTARDCIKLKAGDQIRPCEALFLDLTASPGSSCGGVAIQVCERELRMLDTRENAYERCAVELMCSEGKLIQAFAYMMPESEKIHQGIILARYKQIIDDALSEYPESFARRFWQDTAPTASQVVEGEYIFEHVGQNKAAGRSL